MSAIDFENLIEDVNAIVLKHGGDAAFLPRFEENIDSTVETQINIRNLLETFDDALIDKLKLHEQDFLNAY